MKKILIIPALSLTLLTSCFYAYYPQTGSELYEPTPVESIQIYSGDIKQDYVVMGSVAVDAIGNADDAIKYLKKKAAKMRADAIIRTDIFLGEPTSGRTGISGVAVKMKQNTTGQSFTY